ncbi:hypothetical protein Tco_0799662 [Tanacetum coccineum]|uniref:Uncharacterized protein n=1 Tax=Tanacetum coccineum TaxID=301880 RepID=A0ABQ4ZQZ0_9ASTR
MNPIPSVETLESVPEPVVIKPKVVSQPKVWSDAPMIEEYESNSDDEYVNNNTKTDFSNQKVNTVGDKAVSAIGGIRETAVKDHSRMIHKRLLKGKGIVDSGHVTPLFPTMLVHASVEEGEGGHTSDRAKGGLNLEELFVLCTNLSNGVLALETSKDDQATEILKLKTRIKKLEKKCKPSISHHRAWLRSVSILSIKKMLGKKESVSKQGRKNAKPGPTLDDSSFDNHDADGMDYMDTEEVVNEGRQSKDTEELNVTHDTEVLEKGGSNEEQVNAAGNIGVSIVVHEVSTVNISTAGRPEVSTATLMIPPTTTSMFDNEDIILAETLVKMKDDKAKLKGVAIKEIEKSDRPARLVLTLKPLPKIDPKDKGKCVLEEESEPAKKLKKSDLDAAQLAMDKEYARQVNAELQAELERESVAAEEATQAVLASEFDEIQARMNRKFLAEQRAIAIRNKPLTKTQSAEDERLIDKMNKKAAGEDTSKKEKVLKEPDSTKMEVK